MAINCVIGIDPGSAGGIVIWRPGHRINSVKMPGDVKEVDKLLKYYKDTTNPIIFLEKLQLHHGDIEIPGKAFQVQKMLAGFEQLKAYITVNDIPFVLVHPMKWQSGLKIRVKGSKETKIQRKNRYKTFAGQLYGELKPTLWNADATLIMHFGRFSLKNNPKWVLENMPKEMAKKISEKST